ncbi:MAG: hypothetical protein U0637_07490 [Phycisphaerales bacterium]
MDQVRRVVTRAGRRLMFNSFLQHASLTLTGAMVLAIIARLVERVFSLEESFRPYWMWALVGGGVAALVAAFLWTYATRKSVVAVATEVDERADLREALSTALYVEKSGDAWANAMRETATRVAAGVNVSGTVPVEAPRAWPVPLATLIGLLVLWYAVPSMDVLGHQKVRTAQKEKEKEILQVKAEVAADQQKLKEMLQKSNVDFLKEDANDNPNAPDQKVQENDPEAIKRAAIRDLTSLTNKLEDAQKSEKSMEADALKEAMEQLKQPGPGPMDEMSKQLSKGDFGAAKQALEQLSKQVQDGSMTQQQKEDMKKQAENLAKQLDNLAKQQDQLTKKLQDQGLDKKTAQDLAKKASDASALKDAMDKLPQLSDAQKDALMKMAQSASKSSEACKNMSDAASKMAKGMSQEGSQNDAAQAMQEMSNQLSDAEAMQTDMENLQAAMEEAKDQLAKLGGQCKKGGDSGEGECEGSGKLGQWREGDSSKSGKGSGGPGKSQGGRSPDAQASDYAFEKKKADVSTTAGPIISSRLVQGDQIKGESVAEFSQAVEQGEVTAAEGIDNVRIPREMEGAVKAYFGNLKKKADQAKDAKKDDKK